MMTNSTDGTTRPSFLHGLLSLILPGLGQFVAGARSRGIVILASIGILFGLGGWTIAQRARFPDFTLAAGVLAKLMAETALLLLFLLALRHLFVRYVTKDPVVTSFSLAGTGLIFLLASLFAAPQLLSMAGNPEQLRLVHNTTAVLAGAMIAGIWLWQVADAAIIGAPAEPSVPRPSLATLLLLSCLVIFTLGVNITGIDLNKAISEINDVSRLLPRIIWPWEEAFAYDQEVVEVSQRIQAPCPEGASGPASNQPDPENPWVSVTPTCGDLGVRPLTGGFFPGTELTITGGNFVPSQVVHLLWKNPIGNAFVPRGVGETDIEIDENGEFTTTLNIPDVVVPEGTSVGDQLHTLVVRQESVEVFSGRLSETMKLALAAMLETIMIGLMATFFGIILAFPLSFLAAKNLMASIVSTLEQLVGSVIGLIVGVWVAIEATRMASASLGGLSAAPVPIALISLVAVFGFGFLGMRLFGWLFDKALTALGKSGYWLASLVVSVIAAAPGYLLGLAFSRAVRAIVLGAEVAATDEITYAYIGAALIFLLLMLYFFTRRNSRSISIGLIVYSVVRTLMNIVRSIEPLIWAIVASIWVGLGPFAGTIALTLHTVAALAKLYSEAIESIDPGPLEAIEATGATRLQVIVYAVIPQILPPYISFTIYRWDINIRMSTILGLVGGGGIGFLLIQWIRLYDYEAAGIAIWLITITVATLDYISSEIRSRYV